MMDDHYVICAARNALADALKVLLKPDIMTVSDFQESRDRARRAVEALDVLCEPHRDEAQS